MSTESKNTTRTIVLSADAESYTEVMLVAVSACVRHGADHEDVKEAMASGFNGYFDTGGES